MSMNADLRQGPIQARLPPAAGEENRGVSAVGGGGAVAHLPYGMMGDFQEHASRRCARSGAASSDAGKE